MPNGRTEEQQRRDGTEGDTDEKGPRGRLLAEIEASQDEARAERDDRRRQRDPSQCPKRAQPSQSSRLGIELRDAVDGRAACHRKLRERSLHHLE